MTKLFIYSGVVHNYKKQISMQTLGYLEADSEDEAIGKSYKSMKDKYKVEEGWYGHSIIVSELKDAELISYLVNNGKAKLTGKNKNE